VSVQVAFEYAIVRVVPRVERGEAMNVGVVMFARSAGFLGCAIAFDAARARAFAPTLDTDAIAEHLAAFQAIADGDQRAGPIACFPQSERFHWLVAPRSTTLQVSATHAGLTCDPQATLKELLARLVVPDVG